MNQFRDEADDVVLVSGRNPIDNDPDGLGFLKGAWIALSVTFAFLLVCAALCTAVIIVSIVCRGGAC